MEKLKLNDPDFDMSEILSREELKSILGGTGSGSGSGSGNSRCYNLTKDQCSGACESGGHKGVCAWIKNTSCMCAIAYADI